MIRNEYFDGKYYSEGDNDNDNNQIINDNDINEN